MCKNEKIEVRFLSRGSLPKCFADERLDNQADLGSKGKYCLYESLGSLLSSFLANGILRECLS